MVFLGVIFFIFSYWAFIAFLKSMPWCFPAVLENCQPLRLQISLLPHSLSLSSSRIAIKHLSFFPFLYVSYPLNFFFVFLYFILDFFKLITLEFTNSVLAISNLFLKPSIVLKVQLLYILILEFQFNYLYRFWFSAKTFHLVLYFLENISHIYLKAHVS